MRTRPLDRSVLHVRPPGRVRRLPIALPLLTFLILLALGAPVAIAGEPTVETFKAGISSGAGPNGIAAGPEGDMWFTEYHGEKIGRITQAGAIAEFPAEGHTQLSPGAHPAGIVSGPEGDIWFTEFETGKLGQLDPATGELLGEYSIPNGAASEPDGIVDDPGGELWFAEQGEGEIGLIDPTSHTIAQYLVHQHTSSSFEPSNLAVGSEGDVWFTLTGTGQVGRLAPSEVEEGTDKGVTLYDLPSGTASGPEGIALGPEGDLYVAEYKAAKIARVSPTEVEGGTSKGIAEYDAGTYPLLAASTREGTIYFTDNTTDALVRFDPKAAEHVSYVNTYNGLTGKTTGLAEDSLGHLWFTQFEAPEAIGRLTLTSAIAEEPLPILKEAPKLNPIEEPPLPVLKGGPKLEPVPTPVLEVVKAPTGPIFVGSASSGKGSPITGYKLRIASGAESAQIECGSSSPDVKPGFVRGASGLATLTVTDADGESSSTSSSFSAPIPIPDLLKHPPGKARGSDVLKPIPLIPVYECSPSSEGGSSTSASAAPSSSCEVVAGILRIAGCGLEKVSGLCGVPGPERGLIERHLLPSATLKGKIVGCSGPKAIFSSAGRARVATTLKGSVKAAETLLADLQDAFYVTTQPVLVNGITVTPQKGDAVAFAVGGLLSTSFAKQYAVYMVSTGANESLGGFPLQGGKLDLDVSNLGAAEAQFANFNLKSPVTFGRFSQLAVGAAFEAEGGIPSLPVEGGFTATFVAGGATRIGLNLQLSKMFSNPLDDAPFTGATTVMTSNQGGPEMTTLDLSVPDLNLGLVDLSNLKLHWVAATNVTTGSFGVDIDDAGGAIGGTIAFKGDIVTGGSIFYQADGGSGLQLVGPVFLIGLEDAITIWQQDIPGSKATFHGTSDISVGPAVSNKSCGVVQEHGDTLINIYPGPFEISSVDSGEIFCIPFEQSYFSVNENGYVELGGDIQFEVPDFFTLKANLDGQAYVDAKRLESSDVQLDGSATGTFDFPDPIGTTTVGAEAVISNLGAGLCTELTFLGHAFHPGLTESFVPPPLTPAEFLSNLTLYGDGCDLSPFQPLGKGGPPGGGGTAASVRARAAGDSFVVSKQAANTTIAMQGQGGPPSVTLSGPGAAKIDTASNSISQTALVLRQPSTDTTLVEISSAEAGNWTLAPDPGSPAVTRASIAHELPAPKIKAKVSGHGTHRTMRYRIAPQPGMKVSFVEAGKHGGQQLGKAKGKAGAISFTPSDAASGTRKILAVLTQNGLPRPALTVARFDAAPPRPGKARAVKVKRQRGGLLVSFRAPALASLTLVSIRFADGRSVLLGTSRGGHSVFVAKVPPREKPRSITVTGVRNGLRGPALRVRER